MPRSLSMDGKWRQHAEQRLRSNGIAWLTTVGSDGRPYTVPLWLLWDWNAVLIFSQPLTRILGARGDEPASQHDSYFIRLLCRLRIAECAGEPGHSQIYSISIPLTQIKRITRTAANTRNVEYCPLLQPSRIRRWNPFVGFDQLVAFAPTQDGSRGIGKSAIR